MTSWCGTPTSHFRTEKGTKVNYISFKGIQRLRISLIDNSKITKFASDFVSWSQKSRSVEIGQKFFLICYEIAISQIINYQKHQNLMKLIFIFVRNHQ